MDQIKKNTVPAEHQVDDNSPVFFFDQENTGLRVLFVGNSITLSNSAPNMGWYGDHGMAASSIEKDYVHIVMSKLREKDPNASYCICHGAQWERGYTNNTTPYHLFESARDYNADIIILRVVDNCLLENFNYQLFHDEYKKFIQFFNKSGKAAVILTTGFWKHPGDKEIQRVGQEENYKTVYLGDLGEQDEMKAVGLFEHTGIAAHPGDLGMKVIAERIIDAIKKTNPDWL